MDKILNVWYLKIALSIMLSLFTPVQVFIFVMFFMVFLDTITGTVCAIKMKRFNSRAFRKNFKKIMIYSTCIITIRLVEIGALSNLNTTALTQITAGFLILTEAISIIENLSILGLPVPNNFLNILFKQIRTGIFGEISLKKKNTELTEIEDILYYQIPGIKNSNIRKLLQISFEQYIEIGNQIIKYLNTIKKSDNDLIYYKVLSIIQIGFEEINDNFKEENIKTETINEFREKIYPKVVEWLDEVKEICYRLTTPNKKKDELIKKFTILAYRVIIEAQKNFLDEKLP